MPFAAAATTVLLVVVTLGASATVLAAAPPAGLGPASPHVSKIGWHLVNTTKGSPSGRNWFGMAYDAADRYTVLYGGYDPTIGSFYHDTWTFVGGNWTQLSPTSHPSAASGLHMVYDPMLKGVVAFGGESPYGGAYYNETWLFSAGNWTLLTPAQSPPARSQYAMAYDPADSEIVLFGGGSGGSSVMSDTWTFNGSDWTLVAPGTHQPPGRLFASMVYDANTRQTLLAGGVNYTAGPTNDTWAFSAGAWSKVPRSQMPGRVHTPMVTLWNGTPFFYGGQSSVSNRVFSACYEFFAGTWHHVACGHAPSARSNGGLVYDRADGYVLMFGGGIYPTIWDQTYSLR